MQWNFQIFWNLSVSNNMWLDLRTKMATPQISLSRDALIVSYPRHLKLILTFAKVYVLIQCRRSPQDLVELKAKNTWMWPSRRSLCGQRNRGRRGEGPKFPHFFSFPSLPLPFRNEFYESLFFESKWHQLWSIRKRFPLAPEGSGVVRIKRRWQWWHLEWRRKRSVSSAATYKQQIEVLNCPTWLC